ncbi:MAG: hypothetical protein JNM56_29090 [Planctomycetia bacterium]|nr:hypothetical protein [Planctomycetia bacterium]
MSRERQLKALGLWHLKDKPAALEAELDQRLEKQRQEDEAWEKERDRERLRAEVAAEEKQLQELNRERHRQGLAPLVELPEPESNFLSREEFVAEVKERVERLLQERKAPQPPS